MSPRRIPYFISDSKLLLSSLVPWVALLPSNLQAEGILVKNQRNDWNGSSFYDKIKIVCCRCLFEQLKQVEWRRERQCHAYSTPEKMLKYENCQTSMKPLKAVLTKNIATPVPDS